MTTPRASPARVACLALPSLPLQLALRERPAWRDQPVVVVDKEGPQGVVLWANALARAARITRGTRYAAACRARPGAARRGRARAPALEEAGAALLAALQRCSPRVEAYALSAQDLLARPLRPRAAVRRSRALGPRGRRGRRRVSEPDATVVIGFTRFATLALARLRAARRACARLDAPRASRGARGAGPRAARRAAPRGLPAAPARETLAPLGVRTLGDFLALPAPALRLRFGRAAAELHARARGQTLDPLTPAALQEPLEVSRVVDPPDDHHERLLFILKEALAELLGKLDAGGASERDALRALTVEFEFDMSIETSDLEDRPQAAGDPGRLELRPGAPTRDLMQLVDLLRLRLGEQATRGGLPAPVRALTVTGEPERLRDAQVALLPGQRPRRDPEAVAAALARLRAAFGEQAVTRARLRDAILPEASFTWEQTLRPNARPAPPADPWPANDHDPLQRAPLLRRVFPRPLPLPAPPDGAAPWRVPERPPFDMSNKTFEPRMTTVRRLHGPFRVSGGWWARTVERDYYYAETARGALMWIFYDRPRDRWFWHGLVD
ncbi:MAG: hypothetical protein H6713_05365 [Myxococcales bacterium]|nr:hypothetical protein [Myxococcales bacterium]